MKRLLAPLFFVSTMMFSQTHAAPTAKLSPAGKLPFSISVYDRTRADTSEWFAAPPQAESYGYVESLVRIGIAQHIKHYDWQLEVSQPSILDAPSTSVSPATAQGQLGFGATYYVANGNNSYPVAASLKQGYLRYHFGEKNDSVRLGRFEFMDGVETAPKNPTLAWLQTNRIAQRLIGNFGFSNGQRSFDGADAHLLGTHWDLTALAARVDQGVFNMNGNPELNVDLQYLAFTRNEFKQHVIWRVFGLGYHDGRTGLTKTDNRAVAVRAADHHNIRLGTYGGDVLTTLPVKQGQFDLLAWGAYQNGNWGLQSDSGNAAAVEGGFQLTKVASTPWLRGGFFYGSGDGNPLDGQHNTFVQILPTPRVYARFPFYDLMDSKDQFVQLIDKPAKHVELRSDLHWLQLSSSNDLWYQGGGAYDNKVFGYTGRPNNGHSSFASVADISADWQATPSLAVNFYYAHVWGKSVVGAIYPVNRIAQYGYVEAVYRWGRPQRASVK
jgi:Alginate export